MGPSPSPVGGENMHAANRMTLVATAQRPSSPMGGLAAGHAFPVAVIVLIVLVLWYLAAIPMNRVLSQPLIDAAGGGLMNTLQISWSLPRPVLPAPHQVIAELWNSIFTTEPWRPR